MKREGDWGKVLSVAAFLFSWGIAGLAQERASLVANGDFENRKSVAPWVIETSRGGVRISDRGNDGEPHGGARFAVLGCASHEAGAIEQSVVIPADAADLVLAYAVRVQSPGSAGASQGSLRVSIRGEGVDDTLALHDASDSSSWKDVEVGGLEKYAGRGLTLRFQATKEGSALSRFCIDDVSLRCTSKPGSTAATLDFETPLRGLLPSEGQPTEVLMGASRVTILGSSPNGIRSITASLDGFPIPSATGDALQVVLNWSLLPPGLHSMSATLTDSLGTTYTKSCRVTSARLLAGADFEGPSARMAWDQDGALGGSVFPRGGVPPALDGGGVAALGAGPQGRALIQQAITIPPDAQDLLTLSFLCQTAPGGASDTGGALSVHFIDSETDQDFPAATVYPSGEGWTPYRIPISMASAGFKVGADYYLRIQADAASDLGSAVFYLDDVALSVSSNLLATAGGVPDEEGDVCGSDSSGCTAQVLDPIHMDIPNTCVWPGFTCGLLSHAAISVWAKGFGTMTADNTKVKFRNPAYTKLSEGTITSITAHGGDPRQGYDIVCTVPDAPHDPNYTGSVCVKVVLRNGNLKKKAFDSGFSNSNCGAPRGFAYGFAQTPGLVNMATTQSPSILGGALNPFSATFSGLVFYTKYDTVNKRCVPNAQGLDIDDWVYWPRIFVKYWDRTNDPVGKRVTVENLTTADCGTTWTGTWSRDGAPVVCGEPGTCKVCFPTGPPATGMHLDGVFVNPGNWQRDANCWYPVSTDDCYKGMTQDLLQQFITPPAPVVTAASPGYAYSVGAGARTGSCGGATPATSDNVVRFQEGPNAPIVRVTKIETAGAYGTSLWGGIQKDDTTYAIKGVAPAYPAGTPQIRFTTYDNRTAFYSSGFQYKNSWKEAAPLTICPSSLDRTVDENSVPYIWSWQVMTGQGEGVSLPTPAKAGGMDSFTLTPSVLIDPHDDLHYRITTLWLDEALKSTAQPNDWELFTTTISTGTNPIWTIAQNLPIRLTYAPLPLEVAGVAIPNEGISPLSVILRGTATGGTPPYSWTWDFGDGSTFSGQAPPPHTYTNDIPPYYKYYASFTVRDSAGSTEASQLFPIRVYPASPPNPFRAHAIGSPLCGQPGVEVHFQGTVSGGTPPYIYRWSFGDGSGDVTEQNPSHIYPNAGNWIATLTVTDATYATAGAEVSIKVNQNGCGSLVAAGTANPTSGAAPLTVQFQSAALGGMPPYSFSWAFGDGGTSTSQNTQHVFTSANTYSSVLTVRDSAAPAAESSGVFTITVSGSGNPLSAGGTASPTSGPAPLPVSFTGSASGGTPPYTYSWAFGDGGLSTTQNPSHTYVAASAYTALLTVRDSASPAATSYKSFAITVTGSGTPLTATGTASPTSGTAPLAVNFTGSASGGTSPYTYGWTFGDGGTSSSQNPVHTYTVAGTYTATLAVHDSASPPATATKGFSITATGSGCTLSPNGTASPTSGAAPLGVSFSSSPSGCQPPYTYVWSFGDGTANATTQTASHSYTAAGSYTATLTVKDSASPVNTATQSFSITATGSGAFSITGTTVNMAGSPIRDVVIQLSGAASATATTNSSGQFQFTQLAPGAYTVRPVPDEYIFLPASATVTITTASVTLTPFRGRVIAAAGRVANDQGMGLAGVQMMAGNAIAVTDELGSYAFTDLPQGACTVQPSKKDQSLYLFTPAVRKIHIGSAPVKGVDFTAAAK